MDTQLEEFKKSYLKYCVTGSTAVNEELITPPIPDENRKYDNAVIRGYVLLSRWKPSEDPQMKILTTYEKLLKKNQESGMHLTQKKFANILYILHRYCVRLLKNPWRREFYVIKDYNGFYHYTLARYLSPSVICDLFELMGFDHDADAHTFTLRWSTLLDQAATDFILNAGIAFFLSYIHCRARSDPNFKQRVKGLTHLLLAPSPRDEDTRLPYQGTSRRISNSDPSHQRPKAEPARPSHKEMTMRKLREADETELPSSSISNPPQRVASRHDRYSPTYDDDLLYGTTMPRHSGSAREGTSRHAVSPHKPSRGLDRDLRNAQLDDAKSRHAREKYTSYSEPAFSPSYVEFVPMDKSSVARRGTPDGGIDYEKDSSERRYPKSDYHVYGHIN